LTNRRKFRDSGGILSAGLFGTASRHQTAASKAPEQQVLN
jgi:hypothetical protein